MMSINVKRRYQSIKDFIKNVHKKKKNCADLG